VDEDSVDIGLRGNRREGGTRRAPDGHPGEVHGDR
jgi:hypothetical protein